MLWGSATDRCFRFWGTAIDRLAGGSLKREQSRRRRHWQSLHASLHSLLHASGHLHVASGHFPTRALHTYDTQFPALHAAYTYATRVTTHCYHSLHVHYTRSLHLGAFSYTHDYTSGAGLHYTLINIHYTMRSCSKKCTHYTRLQKCCVFFFEFAGQLVFALLV